MFGFLRKLSTGSTSRPAVGPAPRLPSVGMVHAKARILASEQRGTMKGPKGSPGRQQLAKSMATERQRGKVLKQFRASQIKDQ